MGHDYLQTSELLTHRDGTIRQKRQGMIRKIGFLFSAYFQSSPEILPSGKTYIVDGAFALCNVRC